jgi:preprotein translocase subunit SecE
MPWTKATSFLREVRSEMERVNWPTKDQTIRLTTIVIALTLGIGLYIGLLDVGLTQVTSKLFIR